jgi:hypothetical protein
MRRLSILPALIALALPIAAVSGPSHGHSDYSNHGLSVSIDDWEMCATAARFTSATTIAPFR